MRILLLNQTFYPDIVSTAQHLTDLALGLAEHEHHVTVITSRRAYDEPSKYFPRTELWRGINVLRVRGTGLGKGAKWRRAVDFATFIAACFWRLLWLREPDAVVALTSPPLISFIGAWYARLTGAKFYYWVMDLNPDEAVAAGWLRENSFMCRLLQWMSRSSLQRAEKIIALDRFVQARIAAKGIAPEKIAVIAPWSHDDTVRFDAAARDEFRAAHGLADKFVVMYSGNHSPCHPLDTLLAAARELRGDETVRFLFVGGGSEFGKVKQCAAEEQLPNIICLPYQPMDKLSGSLSAADLHVVVMGDAFVGTIHPCKIYNILAVRAPVFYVGPEEGHVPEVMARVGDAENFYSVRHGNGAGAAAAIRAAAQSRARLAEAGAARLAVEFSRTMLLPKLIAEIGADEMGY